MIGAAQLFRSDSKYVAWGLGYVFGNKIGSGGFFSALGWEPHLLSALTFRIELNVVAGGNGYVRGALYAGLGLRF